MIRHIVVFKVKEPVAENAAAIKALLDTLPAQIPEIRSWEVGIDVSRSQRSYDLVLISEFDSLADLQHYIDHPIHVATVAQIDLHREYGRVVDYERPAAS